MAHTAELLGTHGTTADRTEMGGGRRLDIDQLESLCRGILDILKVRLEPSHPMSTLRDELAGVIQAGVRRLATELRRELPCWTAALEHFRRLSQCRYLALPDSLAAIHDKLEESTRQAQHLVEALETLGERRGPHPPSNGLQCSGSTRLPQQLLEGEVERSHAQARPKLGEAPPVVKEQAAARPAARPQPVRENGRSRSSITPTALTSLRVDCPCCGAQGVIPWDKLGRLHVCGRCSRSFRVDACGGLVEVIRSKENKWVDKEAHAARSHRTRAVGLVTRRLLPVLGLVAVVLMTVRLFSPRAASSEVKLPAELKPRAELFTRAWLKKDWSRMRLLVKPGEDRTLYQWSVRYPPPVIWSQAGRPDPEIQVEATVLSIQSQTATVKVQIRGPEGAAATGAHELVQYWEDRQGTWFFVVPGQRKAN